MVAKAAIDVGAWWLAGIVLLTGFLTTIAVGRVWALAYWRPAPAGDTPGHPVAIGASALVPLIVLTAIAVLIGVFPERLLSLIQDATIGLMEPSTYIRSVFPAGGTP